VSVVGLGAACARAAEPTQQELVDQVKALRAKVEQLEARQAAPVSQPAAATAAPEGRDATIDSVLRDADRRSSPLFLQSAGVTAGYVKNKFIIQDEAGNFVLNPNLQFQFRHVANFRSDNSANGDGDDVIENGFEVRRLKFVFDGSLFGPGFTYKFQWATNRANGTPLLEDAWVRIGLGDLWGSKFNDFALRIGQFKDPSFHEEITSSKRQLAVDRTVLNEVLAGGVTDWVQGVTLIWDDGPEGRPLRAELGFDDGINTDNTNFVDGGGSAFYSMANPDWGAFARVEYLAFGNWKAYDDFTTLGNTEDTLVLGMGATYSENGDTANGGDLVIWTVDAQYELGKLGLYGAYVGAYSEPAAAGGIYDQGFLVQAGYLLNEKWEVFGRYDMTFLDDSRFSSSDTEDTFPEITVGLNYYMKGKAGGHAAKFTIDGTWLPNGAPADLNGIGILDPDGDDDQFVIRTQFQLLI
jgi:hypothetical protein